MYGKWQAGYIVPGGLNTVDAGVALVDTLTAEVLSCDIGQTVRIDPTRSVAVVTFFDGDPRLTCDYCENTTLDLFINTASGIPSPNDSFSSPELVPSLPYTTSGDNALASDDGPNIECVDYPVYYEQIHTLWYRYTPKVTEPTPHIKLQTPSGLQLDAVWFAAGPNGPTALSPQNEVPLGPSNGCYSPEYLVAGTDYFIGVLFLNPENSWGEPIYTGGPFTMNVTPGEASVPGTPQPSGTRKDATSAVVSWYQPESGGQPITGYKVSRDGGSSGGSPWSTTLPADARSKTFTLLKPWDTYTFSVQAINSVGASSVGEAGVTLSADVPSAPTTVAAKVGAVGSGQATVSWSVPAHQGSSALSGYEVRQFSGQNSTPSVVTRLQSSSRSFTAAGLSAGSQYTFDVAAVNGTGVGPRSGRTAAVTPLALPGAPTGLRAVSDGTAKTATLTWTAPTNTGGAPITGYRVSRDGTDSNGTGAFSTTVSATTRSKTFTALNPWDTYKLSVSAITAAGTGPTASASILLVSPTPSAPQTVSAKAGTKSATVTWSAPAHPGSSAIKNYIVKRYVGTSTSAAATVTLPSTARSYTAPGLLTGTSYTFTVTAVNGSGSGRPSGRTTGVKPA